VRRLFVVVAALILGVWLFQGPVTDLFVGDYLAECGGGDDDDRGCHCPPQCPCSEPGCAHASPNGIPPVSVEILPARLASEQAMPAPRASLAPPDSPTGSILKVPIRALA
jgi:hypothetical protein